MKFTLIIDKDREEEVIVYAKEQSPLVYEIEGLLKKDCEELMGYRDGEMIIIHPTDVFCFTIENGKLFAITEKEKIQLRQRLYQIERYIGSSFVKINQSSIANIKKIDRFKASFGGSLLVIFKNGYEDYVSRRQVKIVKERFGVK